MAACACFQTLAALISYSAFTLLLSAALIFTDRDLLETTFLPGVFTILFFAYFGLSRRLKLIAENKKYEQAKVLYEASQESIRTRDEFISVASHELRTPLTTLKLQIQKALRDVRQGSWFKMEPEKITGFLETTDRQVNRLPRLVDEMLDVSRISTEKVQMMFEEFDLAELIRKCVEPMAAYSRVAIELDVPEHTMILADSFRIEQVILNLLSNAIKYGQEKPVWIKLESAPDHVTIIIRDSGMGIEEKDQARIFERFERAVSSTHVSGLGLGLYICKSIIDAHHGKIELKSELGKGSQFSVTLPIRPKALPKLQ